MSGQAIRIQGLSKLYRIGARAASYRTFRETLWDGISFPFRQRRSRAPAASDALWALKDVSFEVETGEVVGLIGRNGAGKSTLLKVLSRITEPTEGRVEIRGRVASLIEVGTGFHAELTGRENIYLNGVILGMTHQEVRRKFEEIVAFADVERFIDTPVKHYSSGMYLRLAFSVAAHLEPDILLVDEVLAVGDAAFQKKCLGKMSQAASQGRTVVFVSHAMATVEALCRTGVVLDSGRLVFHGPVQEAIRSYLAAIQKEGPVVDLTSEGRPTGAREVRLVRFWVEDGSGSPVTSLRTAEACSLAVQYAALDGRARKDLFVSVTIRSAMGVPLSVVNTNLLGQDFASAPPAGIVRFDIPRLPLTAGRYVVDLQLSAHAGLAPLDALAGAASFDVLEGDFYGTGRPGSIHAPMLLEGRWRLEQRDQAPPDPAESP